MMLNDEQNKVFKFICEQKSNPWKIVLNSPGGTGKSYLIKYLCDQFKNSITVLAPTHKARSIFSKDGINCRTIHSFLNSSKEIDEDTGEIYFVHGDVKPNDGIIIVDECSMITEDMLELLCTYKQVLFVGDSFQIPPIGENNSEVFNLDCEVFTFVKNMRLHKNPDSMSTLYLEKFRNQVDHINVKITVEFRCNYDTIFEKFKDNKDAVVLAWTNKKVNFLNREIRSRLFNDSNEYGLQKFYVGESMIFSGYRKTDKILNINSGKIAYKCYHSSDSVEICKLKTVKMFVEYFRCPHQKIDKKISKCNKCAIKGHKVKGYDINFYQIVDQFETVWFSPCEDIDKDNINNILSDFKSHCLKMKNKESWVKYHGMKNKYNASLFYKYAMTVHKSQGSEWDYVFVDINNIRLCRNMALAARLSYTAVSRFKKTVQFL